MSKQEHTPDALQRVQAGDWVACQGSTLVGTVMRLARDGTWADVHWSTGTKRMATSVLAVQTTLARGNGWSVTDRSREAELRHLKTPHAKAVSEGGEP